MLAFVIWLTVQTLKDEYHAHGTQVFLYIAKGACIHEHSKRSVERHAGVAKGGGEGLSRRCTTRGLAWV